MFIDVSLFFMTSPLIPVRSILHIFLPRAFPTMFDPCLELFLTWLLFSVRCDVVDVSVLSILLPDCKFTDCAFIIGLNTVS